MRLATALMIALLSTSPAWAVNFDQPIPGPNGGPITDKDGKPLDKQPTLGSICETALVSSYADEIDPVTHKETITGQEKYDRWKLAQKLHGEVTLTAEELAKIKMLVGKAYLPAIVGPAWQMLDPGEKK